MTESFLAVARELIDSPEAKAAFADDPTAFLAARGLDDLSAAEFDEAVGYVAEVVPVPVARQLAQPTPDTAPEPAALARLAATSVAEESVRETDGDALDLAAVIDPGGHYEVPQSVDTTSLTWEPTAAEEPASDEPAPADAEAVAEPTVDVGDEPAGADGPDADGPDADGEEAPETEPVVDPRVDELEPELPNAADAGLGDAGVPTGDAVPPAPTVETPPEDVTLDDLI